MKKVASTAIHNEDQDGIILKLINFKKNNKIRGKLSSRREENYRKKYKSEEMNEKSQLARKKWKKIFKYIEKKANDET